MALRKTTPSGRNLMLPLLWVLLLIATYWLLAEWHALPHMLAALSANFVR